MLFKNITILNESFKIEKNCYVEVKGDTILSISSTPPQGYTGRQIDGTNKLLTPGFVNSHSHVPMTLLRGYAENLPLDKWLNNKVFPFEAQMSREDVYVASMLGIGEMLSFGITSFTDMYDHCGAIADAVIESGIKANISRGLICFEDTAVENIQGFLEAKKFYEEYHGKADGRILIDLCIHGEYTSTETVVRQIAAYSKKWNTNMHIHLSETKKEHEECKKRRGCTPAKYMYDCGVFDSPTTAAHCVWAEDKDLDLFAEKGVTVAHNPISNLKLGSGIANIPAMLKRGINVALGTDGVSSNNNTNFLEEIKTASLLQKGYYQDPTLLNAATAIKLATVNGSKSQRRANTGLIKEGYKADLLLWRTDTPNMQPVHQHLHNLVYSAVSSDLIMTMVDGRILYENGVYKTIDMERIIWQCQKSTDRIGMLINH